MASGSRTSVHYEVRLIGQRSQMIYPVRKESVADATEYGQELLQKHAEYKSAEIWRGMQCLRTISA